MTRRADPFDWSGGHPALDLANTLDERPSDAPVENLASYASVVRFAAQAGLIDRRVSQHLEALNGPACARIARRVRELRENLFAILAAMHAGHPLPQRSLDDVSLAVRRAHAARALAASGTTGPISHCWLSPASPEVPLHACALAVEDLLVFTDHSRIRKCSADDCAVYFIDTSKAHRRQWCSMQNCGNRAKQRRWRSGAK